MFSCSGSGSGLPFPTAGDLPDPVIKTLPPASSAVAGKFFTIASLGKQEKKNWAHPKQPRKQRSSKFYLFLIFWLSWVFVVLHRLSLDMANGDYTLLKCAGFSLWWHLLVEHRQALGTQASVVFMHGLVVSWHVKSVSPALAGRFLSTTREVQRSLTTLAKSFLPYKVIFHRFRGLRHVHLWEETLFGLPNLSFHSLSYFCCKSIDHTCMSLYLDSVLIQWSICLP